MPLHSCKSYREARQATRESGEWTRDKLQEHSGMTIKEKMRVNEIKESKRA